LNGYSTGTHPRSFEVRDIVLGGGAFRKSGNEEKANKIQGIFAFPGWKMKTVSKPNILRLGFEGDEAQGLKCE
jgi:hypothetical protein